MGEKKIKTVINNTWFRSGGKKFTRLKLETLIDEDMMVDSVKINNQWNGSYNRQNLFNVTWT
jgi:hypothetical protein